MNYTSTNRRVLLSSSGVPIWVDSSVDDFQYTSRQVGWFEALELVAYYRGEPVTEEVVSKARKWLCVQTPPPLPFQSLGYLTFICTDAPLCQYDLSTLCRHFELISDIYEMDPSVRELQVPFTFDQVACALSAASPGTNTTEVIKFLRPKDSLYYLEMGSNKFTMEDLRHIGSTLTQEARLYNSKFASLLTDSDLYPVVSHAYARDRCDEVIKEVLLPDWPSVYTWYLLECVRDCPTKAHMKNFCRYIAESKFEDIRPVAPPSGWCWSPQESNLLWTIAQQIVEPDLYLKVLYSFGLDLDNPGFFQRPTPFGVAHYGAWTLMWIDRAIKQYGMIGGLASKAQEDGMYALHLAHRTGILAKLETATQSQVGTV